jgi:dihydrodipicolinate synthase/N-acetylneuraminate lyase
LCPIEPKVFSPRGVYAPTITAFEKDESVSLSGTRAFVKFLLAQGIEGLVPLGSSGEPLALTMDERKAVLDAVMAEAGGKVPIMAGIVEYSQIAKTAVTFINPDETIGFFQCNTRLMQVEDRVKKQLVQS